MTCGRNHQTSRDRLLVAARYIGSAIFMLQLIFSSKKRAGLQATIDQLDANWAEHLRWLRESKSSSLTRP